VLPGRAPPSVAREFAATRAVLDAEGLDAARRRWFDESGWFEVMRGRPEDCRAEAHRRIVLDFGGAPWRDPGEPRPISPAEAELEALEVPVLAYNGAQDLADFLAAADELEARLPHLRRHTIPEAGGYPAWEVPGRVNALVAAFLAEVDAREGAAGSP
jgi:pimeloyl-ACP methyl ester carboxylesterase